MESDLIFVIGKSIGHYLNNVFLVDYVVFLSISLILLDHVRNFGKILILFVIDVKKRTNILDKVNYNNKNKISILIPALNEEKTIARTIRSVLNLSCSNLEIIVIDDGSDDKTYQIAKKYSTKNQIKLIRRIPGHSKAHALNNGISISKGDIIITIDADAEFNNDKSIHKALDKLENHEEITAIVGEIVVRLDKKHSNNKILTMLQCVEYLIAMNIGKRFHSIFNTILVIPGGLAILRSKYLKKKKFNHDSITEDFDMSLKLHGLGKNNKILYEPGVSAEFACPDSIKGLFHQRVRWAHGQTRTLLNNKNIWSSSRYRPMIKLAMADMWIFDIVLNLVWIVTFLLYLPISLILNIINGNYDVLNIVAFNTEIPFGYPHILLVLLVFYLISEIISFVFAIYISNKKNLLFRLLWIIPLMVIVYRPILRIMNAYGHILGILNKTVRWRKNNVAYKNRS